MDTLFIDCIELALAAGYATPPEKRLLIQRLSTKADALKFFVKLLWEIKAIDHKKYAIVSQPIIEVGKMIGGWSKLLKEETPPRAGGGERKY